MAPGLEDCVPTGWAWPPDVMENQSLVVPADDSLPTAENALGLGFPDWHGDVSLSPWSFGDSFCQSLLTGPTRTIPSSSHDMTWYNKKHPEVPGLLRNSSTHDHETVHGRWHTRRPHSIIGPQDWPMRAQKYGEIDEGYRTKLMSKLRISPGDGGILPSAEFLVS